MAKTYPFDPLVAIMCFTHLHLSELKASVGNNGVTSLKFGGAKFWF